MLSFDPRLLLLKGLLDRLNFKMKLMQSLFVLEKCYSKKPDEYSEMPDCKLFLVDTLILCILLTIRCKMAGLHSLLEAYLSTL